MIEKIDSFDDQFVNLIVMVLGMICETPETEILSVEKLANKLSDDRVIVITPEGIIFEPRSKDNSWCPSISSIVGKIFANALQKKIKITDQSINHLIQALNSKDNQTKILSAKSLFFAVREENGNFISGEALNKLMDYVDDRVPDVAVYSTIAYVKGLLQLSSAGSSVTVTHLEVLSRVYAFEELKLGNESFTEVVNKGILSVLENEVGKKQKFNDDVFKIFDHTLILSGINSEQVIKILSQYVEHNNNIPENTVAALENALGIPELYEASLKILKKLIRNGQVVGEKTLKILAEDLYRSEDHKIRKESFDLLNIVNDSTQELSDEMFTLLELEKSGRCIAESKSVNERKQAVEHLQQSVKNGHELSINIFQSLIGKTSDPSVLVILENVVRNKQIIPKVLIESLILEFNPKESQEQLIQIFLNLEKNNQNVFERVKSKLEEALKIEKDSDQALLIFAFQAQKGIMLEDKIIEKIFEKLLSDKTGLLLKQEYLASIHSIIQRSFNTEFIRKRTDIIQDVLCAALSKNNPNAVKEALKSISVLINNKINVNEKTIVALIQMVTDTQCNEEVRREICSVLSLLNLSEDQKSKLKLSEDKGDDKEFLDRIEEHSKKTDLLEKNFRQITGIINRPPELQKKNSIRNFT